MRDGLRAFGLLLRWQYMRQRPSLVMLVLIQIALACGVIYGLSYLIPDLDHRTALFLATGAPTLTILILGMSVVPQEVTQAKISGRAAYIASLPVPRLAPAAAEVTFWLLVQLPGIAVSLSIASLRFDLQLQVGWGIFLAIPFVVLSGASVGYALATTLRPEIAQHVASFLTIGILLFSPINFPIEQLPGWLQAFHQVLPITYMADLMRWSLTGEFVANPGLALAVVAGWCVAGIALSWRVAARRA